MKFKSWIFFILVFLLEITVTALPLVFIFLLFLIILKKREWIFLLAFMSGIILDTLLLRPYAVSSLYFILFMFLVLLYERKYEIQTLPFIIITSFLGSWIYLLLIQSESIFWYSLLNMILSIFLFIFYSIFYKSKQESSFKKV